MQELTGEGRRVIEDVARRHGFSTDATLAMLMAVASGQGSQAQFNHPEFGGMGQWSLGGMIMIGDMFNNNLKYRVDGLATELSNVLRSQPLYAPVPSFQSQSQSSGAGMSSGVSLFVPSSSSNWWPAEFGNPSSTGSQNDLRYAYFPAARRLTIKQGERVTTYDTGNHQISGFGQQQSGDQSITLTSQFGLVRVFDLPLITDSAANQTPAPIVQPSVSYPATPVANPAPVVPFQVPAASGSTSQSQPQAASEDIFAKIERLAELRQKGVLTDDEFNAKKSELLSRL